ncbi:MAG: CinA family protein [Deltaproteobacteria bacterium]|nr:CinA family protein [Deltaproteobacteria bacterium]
MSFITTEQANLVTKIAAILTAANETLAVAESSAGGLVSACLLSMPGASSFFIGGSVLYSYRIREQILETGKEELRLFKGSTPELFLDMAQKFRKKLGTDWVIGEGGAAGPAKSPYGHNAGYTVLAVAGPIRRAKIIETGKSNRIENMSEFTTALLRFFLDILEERRSLEGTERR